MTLISLAKRVNMGLSDIVNYLQAHGVTIENKPSFPCSLKVINLIMTRYYSQKA